MEKKFGRQCSYWIKAARPRTLPASVSPVLIACAITYKEGFFQLFPAILCVLVALFAQIASNFANDYFAWGDNPTLRWAVNNTKMIRYGRKLGKEDDADIGNFVYAKIEAKSRKTDPFMALVASMTVEDALPYAQVTNAPDLGVFTY